MVLQGEYENIRRFVYELETAPEFVIIDDVTLTQADAAKPLTLTLELSTYYRLGAMAPERRRQVLLGVLVVLVLGVAVYRLRRASVCQSPLRRLTEERARGEREAAAGADPRRRA